MVGGTSGPSTQPNLPNYILVAVPADAVAAVRHSAERQNTDMIKENRKLTEKLCSERIIFSVSFLFSLIISVVLFFNHICFFCRSAECLTAATASAGTATKM